jgi:MFS family permease
MSRRPRTTLIIAVIAQAAVSIVQFGLPAIGVDIQNTFGLGPAGFGAVFAAVGLGSAVALIPAGMLVDRFGARPVLLIGAAINLCAYLAASVAPNAALFAAAIFLAGVGSSAVPVAGMSSLLREFPPERRGIALGWRQLAVPMGGAIGAAALPLLAHVGGVRLALIVTALATASTASVFAWLSAAGGGSARRMRLDGALTARGMRPLLVVGLLYVYALGASLTYIVAAARDDGLGKAEAGALFVVLNLSAAASRLVWGRMADRGGGTRRVRTLVEIGVLATVAALAMAPVLHVGFVLAVPVTVALGFGCFGWNGVLYVTAGELVGPDRAARAVGVASTMVFGAGALAAPVSGLVAEHAGYDVMWLTAAASSVAGATFAWRTLGWMRRPRTGAAVGATAR